MLSVVLGSTASTGEAMPLEETERFFPSRSREARHHTTAAQGGAPAGAEALASNARQWYTVHSSRKGEQ